MTLSFYNLIAVRLVYRCVIDSKPDGASANDEPKTPQIGSTVAKIN